MLIFAGYAAQAIANASAYERMELQSTELARQLQSQRRLLEINERLLSTLDQQHVLDTIADGLRSVVHYDNLSIYRADHREPGPGAGADARAARGAGDGLHRRRSGAA